MSNRRRTGAGRPAPHRGPGNGSKAKLVAAFGLPLLVAVALIGLVPGSDRNDDNPVVSTTTTTLRAASPEARAFQNRVDDALRVFATDRLPAVLRAAAEWIDGKAPPDNLKGELSLFLPEAVRARHAVAAIPVLKEAPSVRDWYRDSVGLYVDFGRVYLAAVDPAAEPLKTQLDLAARRLRVLADRIYDQGQTLIDPASQSLGDESVEIRRGPEVPDWEAEGLAAGPPLAGVPPPAPEVPPGREGEREEEPEKEWLARLRKAGFPSGADLAAAIAAGDAVRLGGLAETYLASVAALRVAPDPQGGRVRAAVVALSFLVDAESARVAQGAAVLPEGPARDRLSTVAGRLALIGENLLEPDLRGRPSGFDAGLLEDSTP